MGGVSQICESCWTTDSAQPLECNHQEQLDRRGTEKLIAVLFEEARGASVKPNVFLGNIDAVGIFSEQRECLSRGRL